MICFHPLLEDLLSLVALILLLLCLFAGSSRQFLPNAPIFTVTLSERRVTMAIGLITMLLQVNVSDLPLQDAPDFFWHLSDVLLLRFRERVRLR